MYTKVQPVFWKNICLYMMIDNYNVFEYDWTKDRWRYCKTDAFIGVQCGGIEISEKEAVAYAKKQRKEVKEPYKRIYAVNPHFL